MDYKYDIFISYRSKCKLTPWMRSVFLPLLEEKLGPNRINGLDVWIDDRIESGDNWPESLREALATSRLLLPILTPYYFGSDWCRKELSIMLERQTKLGLCSASNLRGLIIPIRACDGDKYPTVLTKHIQLSDFRDYIDLRRGTRRWNEFKSAVEKLAKEIDQRLNQVPQFCPSWRDIEGQMIEPDLRVDEPRIHDLPRLIEPAVPPIDVQQSQVLQDGGQRDVAANEDRPESDKKEPEEGVE